ncbi:60s acidic ribosomal protein-domain-containing protein [Cokeromyces recurvatus]|uniref:60s acidic ribosomal protein-domain-containing protein n=1 Tax=Cokeromyces recurvatus TaxID=90255 RepID=UPI00221E7D3C|nr:60s acidic ribosomal protein-domain-containing protein [Cokeromyces recurvatus]KAI7906589.1 60s acidic ribosomal protein-domain-containing protein [Cokeromyces recurvatus]
MKYLAAYLLLNVAGKANPAAEDVKSLLSSVGIESDEERVSSLISALAEKDIAELIAEGKEKMSSVPTGGAVAASGAAAAASGDAPAEEQKEEEKEESDEDMGFGLFD